MTWPAFLQYALFVVIVIGCAQPVGSYLFCVFEGERTLLDPLLRPVERWIYHRAAIDPQEGMNWKAYALAFLAFSVAGTALLLLILMLQQHGPWFDPVNQNTPMTVDLALNTAISFATTTTWQAYGGETTMSYFSQIVGLAAQNFLAGAAGLAVGIAFIRGIARNETRLLGNFWVDVTRATLWVLVPLSVIGGLLLIWQGVPMNFAAYTTAHGLEGGTQLIAQGPVAALEVIKNFGTNGGGFFNVNAAHPFENPTPLTNFLELLMIVVLPAGLTYTFGRMIGRPSQGWMILGVMTLLFAGGLGVAGWAEQSGSPAPVALGVDSQASAAKSGGNMEGKEVRFGVHGSVLAAVVTSNGATGSYNSMHDSFTPLGGMVPMVNMMLGEIVYGGLGAGIYSMVIMILVTVFLGGLMVGQTPHFVGKQLTTREMKLVVFYIIAGSAAILLPTMIAVVSPAGLAGLTTNHGVHGFSEILFAYASSAANNGQNFAGLNANSVFYNVSTAFSMLIGRFVLAGLALALAGAFAEQKRRPITSGHLPTDTPLFGALLIATIIILGGLSFLPTLALGPVAEQVTRH